MTVVRAFRRASAGGRTSRHATRAYTDAPHGHPGRASKLNADYDDVANPGRRVLLKEQGNPDDNKLARLEEQNGHLTEVKVDKVLRLLCENGRPVSNMRDKEENKNEARVTSWVT